MIYFFVFITILLGIMWTWKFVHFQNPQNQPSEAEKLTIRSLPITILVILGILFYFWSYDKNPLHLFYIYPLTFFTSQFFLSSIFAPRVRKEYDYYLDKLIEVLEIKPSREKLKNSFKGYRLLASEELPKKFNYEIDKISNEFVIEDEKEIVSACAQEMLKINLLQSFPKGTNVVSFVGEFRNDPAYATVYFQNDYPIAVGFTSMVDARSHQYGTLGIYLNAMRSCISDNFISKKLGKPTETEPHFHWGKNDISAILDFSPGPSLTLFIFNNKVLKELTTKNNTGYTE